ncbi:MAG: TonB-dependent receptor plug domain-containing protein [Armatimonadota bacterium]|nr:TonB-dependent receptor plug domain-containing protein [bacterium]
MQEVSRSRFTIYNHTLLRVAAIALTMIWCGIASADDIPKQPAGSDSDLASMSLEELMSIEVTSASRKPQKLSDIPAAVYVITQEDIHRSGATCIPDALRMVPGISVSQVDSSKWQVGVRGFNGRFSNKLLVMIDGRSVYTPTFSGVYWDIQNLLLEDIDRIEVIRGPGGATWGANAVNGIINIITKPADQTQQNLMSSGIGNGQNWFSNVRVTGAVGENADYRIYGSKFSRGDDGDPMSSDGWDMQNAGFRADWQASGCNRFTFEGNSYDGNLGQNYEVPVPEPPFSRMQQDTYSASGWNTLARWEHANQDGSGSSLQFFAEHSNRSPIELSQVSDTLDFDYQRRVIISGKHDRMWGVGYRISADDTQGGITVSLNPASATEKVFTGFFQDCMALRNNLSLTVGAKCEHNEYTGLEFQPSVRLAYTPNSHHTLWGAISRAVRTPSRIERDAVINYRARSFDGHNSLIQVIGNSDFASESVIAHELGARLQSSDKLSLDISAFYNIYRNLRSSRAGEPYEVTGEGQPYMIIPVYVTNTLDGSTNGYEIAATWDAAHNLRLRFGYSRLNYSIHYDSQNPYAYILGNDSITNSAPDQWFLTSYLNLGRNIELDTMLYYTGTLVGRDNTDPHYRLDIHLGYRPRPDFEVSLVGQDIFEDDQPSEHAVCLAGSSSISQRNIYGKLTWTF